MEILIQICVTVFWYTPRIVFSILHLTAHFVQISACCEVTCSCDVTCSICNFYTYYLCKYTNSTYRNQGLRNIWSAAPLVGCTGAQGTPGIAAGSRCKTAHLCDITQMKLILVRVGKTHFKDGGTRSLNEKSLEQFNRIG